MKKSYYKKIRDRVTKVIRFAHKTVLQLQQAMVKLKTRYKKVKLFRELKSGLYNGYMEVSMY